MVTFAAGIGANFLLGSRDDRIALVDSGLHNRAELNRLEPVEIAHRPGSDPARVREEVAKIARLPLVKPGGARRLAHAAGSAIRAVHGLASAACDRLLGTLRRHA
jgi:hypothetical protein